MLKNLLKIVSGIRLTRNLPESASSKVFQYGSAVFSKRNFNIHRKYSLCFTGLSYQKNKFYFSKRSGILLGFNILTFLGLRKPTPEEKENELILRIKKGILAIEREQFEQAEQILHSALQMAIDEKDEDGITYIYDVLANLAFQRKQYAKSEKLFVNVLQRLIAKGEEEDSNRVVEISLKLAKIFEDTKHFKKAEQGYKFCIETLDKKVALMETKESEDEDTLALWGMSVDWYGRYLLGINQKTEALKCFKKAYEMCVRVNGLEHEQTAVLLNDLGTVSSMIGDNNSALSYLEEARNIGSKIPDMKELASIYVNLGQLYLLREMYQEGRIACQEGFNMAKHREDEVALSEARHCLDAIKKVLESKELGQIKA